MYKYHIDKIAFNNGKELRLGDLTVIVGPNNSGKSRILKDINELITKENPKTNIVKSLEAKMPKDMDDFMSSYKLEIEEQNNYFYLRGLDSEMKNSLNLHLGDTGWKSIFNENLKSKNKYFYGQFRSLFGSKFVTFLNTSDRLNLACNRNIINNETNLLTEFYNSGRESEDKLRKVIKEAFKLDIRLDSSYLGQIKFRIAECLDNIPSDQRDIRQMYMDKEIPVLDDQGDGIKSFVATSISMILGNKDILLLDEPEAFLHPPQAIKLGEMIAEYSKTNGNVIVSTHSADILKGIIGKRIDVNIIRVERTGDDSKINIIDPNDIREIATNPLFSSSRVLDGIFYKGCVVVEADADAAFYQRVYRQLEKIDDIHYTNAHNKQTVTKVIKMYKKMGVKSAGIVDFDMLRIDSEFRQGLKNIRLEQEKINSIFELRKPIIDEINSSVINDKLEDLKNELENIIKMVEEKRLEGSEEEDIIKSAIREMSKIKEDRSQWSKYKDGGVNELIGTKDKFDCIYNECKSEGLFIVPVGELESWLIDYGIKKLKNKGNWINQALIKLDELDVDENKNPWKFVKEIAEYILNK